MYNLEASVATKNLCMFAPSCPGKSPDWHRGTFHACIPAGPSGAGPMKIVMAIIKPVKLDDVIEALSALGIAGFTVSSAMGFGKQKSQAKAFRGREYDMSFVPKTKIELAVAADRLDAVVNAIRTAAATGKVGDGKIFVLDAGLAVRIRTGDTNEAAV